MAGKWAGILPNNWNLACDPGRHLQECSGARAGKCPAECLLSVFGHLAESAPKSVLSAFWRSLAPKPPKSTQKALFVAFGPRCPKTLKKHFPARAPEHSCKWRPGLQNLAIYRPCQPVRQPVSDKLPIRIWSVRSQCQHWEQSSRDFRCKYSRAP